MLRSRRSKLLDRTASRCLRAPNPDSVLCLRVAAEQSDQLERAQPAWSSPFVLACAPGYPRRSAAQVGRSRLRHHVMSRHRNGCRVPRVWRVLHIDAGTAPTSSAFRTARVARLVCCCGRAAAHHVASNTPGSDAVHLRGSSCVRRRGSPVVAPSHPSLIDLDASSRTQSPGRLSGHPHASLWHCSGSGDRKSVV